MTKAEARALLGDNGAVPSSAKAPKIALGMSLFNNTDEEHTLAAKGTTDSGNSALILEWR